MKLLLDNHENKNSRNVCLSQIRENIFSRKFLLIQYFIWNQLPLWKIESLLKGVHEFQMKYITRYHHLYYIHPLWQTPLLCFSEGIWTSNVSAQWAVSLQLHILRGHLYNIHLLWQTPLLCFSEGIQTSNVSAQWASAGLELHILRGTHFRASACTNLGHLRPLLTYIKECLEI